MRPDIDHVDEYGEYLGIADEKLEADSNSEKYHCACFRCGGLSSWYPSPFAFLACSMPKQKVLAS